MKRAILTFWTVLSECGCVGAEAAGLYMYISDSPFAFLDTNDYMSFGRTIWPVASENEYFASLGNGTSETLFVVSDSSGPVNTTVAGNYIPPE